MDPSEYDSFYDPDYYSKNKWMPYEEFLDVTGMQDFKMYCIFNNEQITMQAIEWYDAYIEGDIKDIHCQMFFEVYNEAVYLPKNSKLILSVDSGKEEQILNEDEDGEIKWKKIKKFYH